MGSGSYDYIASSTRSRSYANQSRETVFHNESIYKDMIIYRKVRESRDSEEHPESFPIIIGLDVTGSMGYIPEYLIKDAFPEIMKTILDAGVKDPQVCFMAFGDQYSDRSPIQVGQFESSDELMEKWLKNTYIESGGGGDGAESPNLVWFTAINNVDTDSYNIRNKKGVIITISDEACHKSIHKGVLQKYFGIKAEKDIPTSKLLEDTKEKWDVYHINYKNGGCGNDRDTVSCWSKLLGENYVTSTDRDAKDIVNLIPELVLRSYNSETPEIELGD